MCKINSSGANNSVPVKLHVLKVACHEFACVVQALNLQASNEQKVVKSVFTKSNRTLLIELAATRV